MAFAIGPFEEINFAAFRESDEEEKLGRNAITVYGFYLPGRGPEVQNTCFPITKVRYVRLWLQAYN